VGAAAALPGPGAAAVAPAAPAPNLDSADGMWVIEDPVRRQRRLEVFYDVPDKEMGKGAQRNSRRCQRAAAGAFYIVAIGPRRTLCSTL
jgi:hypothetical protein